MAHWTLGACEREQTLSGSLTSQWRHPSRLSARTAGPHVWVGAPLRNCFIVALYIDTRRRAAGEEVRRAVLRAALLRTGCPCRASYSPHPLYEGPEELHAHMSVGSCWRINTTALWMQRRGSPYNRPLPSPKRQVPKLPRARTSETPNVTAVACGLCPALPRLPRLPSFQPSRLQSPSLDSTRSPWHRQTTSLSSSTRAGRSRRSCLLISNS